MTLTYAMARKICAAFNRAYPDGKVKAAIELRVVLIPNKRKRRRARPRHTPDPKVVDLMAALDKTNGA